MPYVEELIAYNRTVEEICKIIGSDKLIYQDLDDLVKSVATNLLKEFDTSCFSGEYITPSVNKEYLKKLHSSR